MVMFSRIMRLARCAVLGGIGVAVVLMSLGATHMRPAYRVKPKPKTSVRRVLDPFKPVRAKAALASIAAVPIGRETAAPAASSPIAVTASASPAADTTPPPIRVPYRPAVRSAFRP